MSVADLMPGMGERRFEEARTRGRAAHWHLAFAPCPCGCGTDADWLLDDETDRPILWHCTVTDQSGGTL